VLKISIVMLTTAVFAGLLIAEPSAPLSAAAGRTRIATADAGTVVNPQQSGQTPSSAEASAAAPPVVRQEIPIVSKAPTGGQRDLPVLDQPVRVASLPNAVCGVPDLAVVMAPQVPAAGAPDSERQVRKHAPHRQLASRALHYRRHG
jgi:hypothetical protein